MRSRIWVVPVVLVVVAVAVAAGGESNTRSPNNVPAITAANPDPDASRLRQLAESEATVVCDRKNPTKKGKDCRRVEDGPGGSDSRGPSPDLMTEVRGKLPPPQNPAVPFNRISK